MHKVKQLLRKFSEREIKEYTQKKMFAAFLFDQICSLEDRSTGQGEAKLRSPSFFEIYAVHFVSVG